MSDAVLEHMRTRYRVDAHWLPNRQSAQTLADQVWDVMLRTLGGDGEPAMGRATPMLKRTSHVEIVVTEAVR